MFLKNRDGYEAIDRRLGVGDEDQAVLRQRN
jgi:hypothetical protein